MVGWSEAPYPQILRNTRASANLRQTSGRNVLTSRLKPEQEVPIHGLRTKSKKPPSFESGSVDCGDWPIVGSADALCLAARTAGATELQSLRSRVRAREEEQARRCKTHPCQSKPPGFPREIRTRKCCHS